MKKKQSRSLGSEIANDGEFLAGWLNSDDGWGYSSESQQHTKELVLQLASLRDSTAKRMKLGDGEKDSINAALARYPSVLRLVKISRTGVPVFMDWQAAPEEGQTWAAMVINLARAGHLDRLRRCVNCRAWLFAKRNTRAVYCSTPCRQKIWRANPENKEKNREYQRDHYERLKQRLERLKEKRNAKKRRTA